LSRTPYRWLDLGAFARHALAGHEVAAIRYFTAKVSGVSDPQSPVRQQTYLHALRTVENLSIHFGSFQRTKDWQRLVGAFPDPGALPPPPSPQVKTKDGQQRIKVHRSNEKGSDVNLASYLLLDTFRKDDLGFDGVAVVTNDSDLVTPITMVRDELKTDVLVLDPQLDPRHADAEAKELKTQRPAIERFGPAPTQRASSPRPCGTCTAPSRSRARGGVKRSATSCSRSSRPPAH
jgi:hypothetical protein